MATNLTPARSVNEHSGKGCDSVEKTYKQMFSQTLIHSVPGRGTQWRSPC